MSGHGAPVVTVDGRGLRVAVVAASWHEQVMDGLVDGALRGVLGNGPDADKKIGKAKEFLKQFMNR